MNLFLLFYNGLLPIYHAAHFGSNETVSALLSHGSPTAYLNEPTTPLSISIKHQHLQIAFYLIENGADPDANIEHSPILYAIKNKDPYALRLLLLAGASTECVREETIPNELKILYNNWNCSSIESVEQNKLNEGLNKLTDTLIKLQPELTAFIDKSNDPSYLSGYLTPVINEVNEKVVKVAKFVKNIESCFRHIQNTRLEYLKKQFIYLEEIEKKDIESAFNDDDQLWLNVIADTKNKLKSAYDTSSSLFPGNCYNQIAALPEQFLSIRSELFQPVSMPAPRNNDMLSKQREYRCNLLALNSLLKRLKLLCFDTHNMITTFSEGIITLLDKVEQILEQLRDLVVREQQLNFDFQKKHPDIEPPPKEVIKALDEKRMQLELDMAFLKLEKENFQSISINILRLVRHCIN